MGRLMRVAKPTSGGERVKSDGVEDMAFQQQLEMGSCGLTCGGIEVLPLDDWWTTQLAGRPAHSPPAIRFRFRAQSASQRR